MHIGTAAPSDEAKKPYKRYSFTDTGNAERFRDRFHKSVLYNYTAKAWMYYDTLRWVQDGTGEAKRLADEAAAEYSRGLQTYLDNLPFGADADDSRKDYLLNLKTILSSRGKTAMLTEATHKMSVESQAFDQHHHLLNVLNGTINLTTGDLLAHDRKDMISKIATSEYTDKCDTPRWSAFLDEIFDGDQDLIRYIQKAIGYSLSGSTEEHCAFFCYGTGRNGKSTMLDIISDLLGDYAINIQPETIMVRQASSGPTSDIARLKGARFGKYIGSGLITIKYFVQKALTGSVSHLSVYSLVAILLIMSFRSCASESPGQISAVSTLSGW